MAHNNELSGAIYDVDIPSGNNFEKAEFRLWIPNEVKTIKGILVLVPGSNGDGRPWVEISNWQKVIERSKQNISPTLWHNIAISHDFALLGCYFTDKHHENMFIEKYAKVDEGSGQALLTALDKFAEISGHSEIGKAPIALWGISAGGQCNYEFSCWKPERVIAYVLNKGGIYYTALVSNEARKVPGIFFVGEKDSPYRNNIIKGIFTVNRRAMALWTLIEEPGAVHEFGVSLEVSKTYFDEVIPLRLPLKVGGKLRDLNLEEGYIGDHKTGTYSHYDVEKTKDSPTSWIPTEKIAKIWQNSTAIKPL